MNFILRFALLATCLAVGAAAAGPIGTYYITDRQAGTIYAIKGNDVGSTPQTYRRQETAIAIVGQEVRTTGWESGFSGSGYAGVDALTLTPTGAVYPNSVPPDPYYYNPFGPPTWLFDGTSDGQHNYAVSWYHLSGNEANKVFQFDNDWSNPRELFTLPHVDVGVPPAPLGVGITFDWTNDSLWFNDSRQGTVANYDLIGNLLGNFSVAADLMALAMDRDHTLWLTGNGALYHYATNGTLLGVETPPGIASLVASGGEIDVPEPAPLALAAFGLAGFRARGRIV